MRASVSSLTPPEDGPELRAEIIATARRMNASGINVNKAGNVSVRCQRGARAGLLITPTGVPYDRLEPDDLVFLPLSARSKEARDNGPIGAVGARAPSSEWRFHLDILRERPEFAAIVHYMVAVAGGNDIRCASYATFGTQALSDHALVALAGRRACLLAHHGVIACGVSLDSALTLAIEVEHLARIYLQARTLGEPPRLPDDEMARVLDKFATYGQALMHKS
jgi:L-fuculose-phosphate aldolase